MKRTVSSSGLSLPAILAIGFVLAVVLFSGFLVLRFLFSTWSPSLANAEKLLAKGRFDEALAITSQISLQGKGAARLSLLNGKIWMSKAWQRQQRTGWREYGINSENWISGPEIERAIELFRTAIRHHEELIDAHYWLGLACRESGWFPEAENELLFVLKHEPHHTAARVVLGSLYAAMGQLHDAEMVLREAFAAAPTDPSVTKNLAFLYRFYIDKPESAMVWFNRYLNLSPERDLDVNLARKELQEMLDRYPEFKLLEEPRWREKKKFYPRKRFP